MVSYFLGISIKHSKVFVNYSGLLEKKERLFQYNCFHRRPVLNKENLHVNTRSENQKQKKKNLKRHFESHSKNDSMMLFYHLYSHYNFEAKDNIQSY